MKYIFYLLIVINLVFLVWKFGLQQKESLWQDEEEQRIDVTEGATAMPAGVDWDDGFETLPPESDPDDALPGEASALPAKRQGNQPGHPARRCSGWLVGVVPQGSYP